MPVSGGLASRIDPYGVEVGEKTSPFQRGAHRAAILLPLILSLLLYVNTVLLAVFFPDSQTLLDDRILSPCVFLWTLYLLSWLLVCSVTGDVSKMLLILAPCLFG